MRVGAVAVVAGEGPPGPARCGSGRPQRRGGSNDVGGPTVGSGSAVGDVVRAIAGAGLVSVDRNMSQSPKPTISHGNAQPGCGPPNAPARTAIPAMIATASAVLRLQPLRSAIEGSMSVGRSSQPTMYSAMPTPKIARTMKPTRTSHGSMS